MSDRYLHDAVPQQNTSNDLHGSEREQPLPSDPKDQLMQPGLEVAPSSDNDKYFVANRDEEGKEVQEVEHTDEKSHKPLVNPHWQESTRHEPNKSVRLFGMKRTVFWSLLVGALLVVALAIGLGVGLTSRQSDETASTSPASDNASSSAPEPSADPTENRQLHIGGSIDPSYYTTSGAWNGSGTAYIWQNFTQDWDDILSTNEYSHVVYYQHHAGEIRWMRQASDYSWKDGPQDLLVVATDAKNSTPISAVQYTMDGVNYWNVFYLDSENFIRQRSGNNQSTGWTEGSISKAKLAAWNGDLVGLSACESAINGSIPVRLFYASNSTAFEEYLWYAEEDEWVWQKTWNGYSGAAGVGCHPGIGYYRYTGLVNPSNRIEIWYQPTEDIMADWQPAQFEIPNVHPASSLILTRNYVFYQENATNAIEIAAVHWDNFYTRKGNEVIDPPTAGLSGVSGTHLDAKENGNYTWIFYQRNGDDVTWLEQGPDNDRWQVKSPIS